MRVLFEIINLVTGAHHFAFHENCETARGAIGEVETVLCETNPDETKWINTRAMKPEADMETFFKAHERAHNGVWIPRTETVWILKPN